MSNRNRKSQLEKLEQAENRVKARKQKLINSMRNDKRKLDTRMKVLLGASVLKSASESEPSRQNVRNMVAMLKERDQKAFETLFESWAIADLAGMEDGCSNIME